MLIIFPLYYMYNNVIIISFEFMTDFSAQSAEEDGVPVFKFKRWRQKGKPLPEVLAQYKGVGAELNVLPFCSQFIPMDVINHPKHQSICYHPSILPRGRGASAINWLVLNTYLFIVFIIPSIFYICSKAE